MINSFANQNPIFLIALFLILNIALVNGQVNHKIILDIEYEDSPIELKTDNAGKYAVSHFLVDEYKISLYDFNKPKKHLFENGNYLETQTIEINDLEKGLNKSVSFQDNDNKENLLFNIQWGLVVGNEFDKVNIIVESKNLLRINSDGENGIVDISVNFPNDLAYADLIGIDNDGFLYLIVERYIQQVPLIVSREVYTLNKSGKTVSVLMLPDIKYLYTLRDLTVDAYGNLYHMLTTDRGIKIFRWGGLNNHNGNIIKYPDIYNYSVHYNNLLPTEEAQSSVAVQKSASSTRPMSLRIAEGYVYHKYTCRSDNLAPTDVTAPDGDVVRTPGRLIVGQNARIPYKWGGFNTLNQFDQGLANGKYAGDINTNGVSYHAVGVDCSGFVSRCWQLSYHSSTSHMPNITNLYSDWSDLKPGDAVHKVGHVRLYVSTESNGSIKIVESTSRGWGVSYWSYAPSDLTSYSPRYYENMSNDYYENQPRLLSAVQSGDIIKLNWESGNSDLLGYRLYRSQDRVNWTMIYDDTSLNKTTIEDSTGYGVYYYRISSVKDNPPYYSESDLSNELAVGRYENPIKYLIIDGFDRESGSWRGDGHKFVGRYGKSLSQNNISFDSRKSISLYDADFIPNEYDAIFWIAGDESTADETFSPFEQDIIKVYLEDGNNLFVTGSEIGWDLDYKGSFSDKSFYSNYLKADYVSDDAGVSEIWGKSETSMDGCNFIIGQAYDEDYPDEISSYGGSMPCMIYSNNKIAGIEYEGSFGGSELNSKLIYFAFPLETTADEKEFDLVIENAVKYFENDIVSVSSSRTNREFNLFQNYPNPFNPSTLIKYTIPGSGLRRNKEQFYYVRLKIFDLLGREVATLVNEVLSPGNYETIFNAYSNGNLLSSGVYYYQLKAGDYIKTKKMLILR